MSGDGEALVQQIAEAMSGREVWVGFRDEAGDDACASGVVDFSDLRDLARAVLPLVEAQVAPLRDEVERLMVENERLHLRCSYELAGAETRAELAEAGYARLLGMLASIRYTMGVADPTGGDGYLRGTWADIERALAEGRLTGDEYNHIASRGEQS